MIDYKIETFLTLCETKSYRKTAEVLNLTQPAITHHIKQLEQRYNCKLFDYKNRALKKTEEAELLERYARGAKYNSDKLRELLAKKGGEQFRIGATKTIGDYIIIGAIKELLAHSDVELTVDVDNTESLLEKLKKGVIDTAFVEGFINREEFEYNVYREEELICIAAKDSPLCKGEYRLSDICGERLILREEGSGTREALCRLLDTRNMSIDSFHRIYEINSFKVITELVAADIGISFVYSSVAKDCDLVGRVNIKGMSLFHEFGCIYLKDAQRPPLLDIFLDFSD